MRENSTFFNDLVGIVTGPGETLGQLARQKKWLPMFILILTLTAVTTYITLPTEMSRVAESEALAGQIPGDQLARLGNVTTGKRILVSAIALFATAFALAVGAFFIYLFFGIGGAEGYYVNFFTLTVNASLFDMVLPMVLRFVGTYIFVDLASFGYLVTWLPASAFNPTGFTYMLLAHIDLFSIGYIAAVAMGVSVFAKMKLKKCAFIAVLYFVFKALVASGFYYLVARAVNSAV